MKPSNDNSFPRARRSLITAALTVLLGTSMAVGQSSAPGSSGSSGSSGSAGASGSSSTRDRSGSTSTQPGSSGSTYGTGATGSASSGSSSTGAATGGTTGSSSTSPHLSTTSSSIDTAGGATTMTGSGKLGFMDRRFVSKSAEAGMAELSLAQLASEQATNPEVKSFAQTLIKDHSMVNSELTSMASQRQVDLDKDDPKQERSYKKLAKKSGSDFDQEFVEHMIDMHEDDVKRFEKAAKDAKDPAVRAFATKHIDHLRQHLQTAQGLRQTIMPTGRDDSTSSSSSSSTSPSSSSVTSPTSSGSTYPSSSSSSTSADPSNSSSGATGTSSSGTSGTSKASKSR